LLIQMWVVARATPNAPVQLRGSDSAGAKPAAPLDRDGGRGIRMREGRVSRNATFGSGGKSGRSRVRHRRRRGAPRRREQAIAEEPLSRDLELAVGAEPELQHPAHPHPTRRE
jgi:hypothetical protein